MFSLSRCRESHFSLAQLLDIKIPIYYYEDRQTLQTCVNENKMCEFKFKAKNYKSIASKKKVDL